MIAQGGRRFGRVCLWGLPGAFSQPDECYNVHQMSMLPFFPWWPLKKPIGEIGDFRLIPYQRGVHPFGGANSRQMIVDQLLEPYKTHMGQPIKYATLVQIKDSDTRDLTDDERSELFLLSEMISFSGLATREYFGAGFNYVNHENFTFIIQGFQGTSAGGVALRTRKREGTSLNYMGHEDYQVICPFHVDINEAAEINVPLVQGLMTARDLEIWPRIEEAIFGFNRANTDSPAVMEQAEAVMMIGAMERL